MHEQRSNPKEADHEHSAVANAGRRRASAVDAPPGGAEHGGGSVSPSHLPVTAQTSTCMWRNAGQAQAARSRTLPAARDLLLRALLPIWAVDDCALQGALQLARSLVVTWRAAVSDEPTDSITLFALDKLIQCVRSEALG
jgi:hypothetical protein